MRRSSVTTSDNEAQTQTGRVDGDFGLRLATFISTDVADGGGEVDGRTDLLLTGLVDSLGVVMIVDWIERELDIAIDPGDVVLEHFRSVDAMVGYLRAR